MSAAAVKSERMRERAALISRAYAVARRQLERERGPGAALLPPVARRCSVGPGWLVLRNDCQDLATLRIATGAVRFVGWGETRIGGRRLSRVRGAGA